jgi:hypothetical protein
MKFEIYERLNTGSISLNAQELRNSIYRGTFNNLLHELAKRDAFRTLIGTKVPRRRMVDEEAILRFFAMRAGLGVYRTPLKKFLNEYMGSMRHATEKQIAEHRVTFEQTADRVSNLLGASAFRMLGSDGLPAEPGVNRALLEAQLLASSWITSDSKPSPHKVKKEISALFQKEQFTDAIQRATGDRSRALLRVRETVTALRRAGAQLEVPYNLDD